MPKSISLLLILCLISVCYPQASHASSRGVVGKRISGCDYFVVSAPGGYAVLEWFGGHDPDTGDVIIGNFESFGMHDVLDDTADEALTLWTENYALSKGRALEILLDKCGD
jgi:hypothetical protein